MYVGQTRSRRLIASLIALGYGEMTQPNEWPPRRHPWVLDNGAFKAWKAGKVADTGRLLDALERCAGNPPDFVVVPDLVGEHASLAYSLKWAVQLRRFGVPLALAVQDGMSVDEVRAAMGQCDVLFVGGTLKWKIATGAVWCALSRESGKPCHIGRVSGTNRVRWAQRIGATSIDSCVPLWSDGNLRNFVAALESPPPQCWLFGDDDGRL